MPSAVSKKDKLLASRHKNIATHSPYQSTTSKNRDSRYKIFGVKNKPELDDANKVDSLSKIVALTHAALPSTQTLTSSIQPPIFQNLLHPPHFPVPTPPYFPLHSPYFPDLSLFCTSHDIKYSLYPAFF